MKRFLKVLMVFSFLIPSNTLAQSITEKIQETGILKVGIRQDSPLFGSGESFEGYCADFAQKLAQMLSQEDKKITLQLIPSTTQTRWELVHSGQVDIECGPNTKITERETRHKIKFSQPFFVTATQILVSPQTSEPDLEKGTIGVIAETSNEQDILQVYQSQQISNHYSTRQAGISAVTSGKIEGFASDGILLIGTTMDLNLSPERYNLITPIKNNRPFCAAYSMILPDGQDNQSWRDQVNAMIIENGQGTEIWNQWFLPFVPYMKTVLQGCQMN